jgi:hypothetical protein
MTEAFEKAVLNEQQTRVVSSPAVKPFPETAIPKYGLLPPSVVLGFQPSL